MADLIKETIVKARKDYDCMSTPWIVSAEDSMGPEFKETLSREDYDFWEKCDGKIRKGEAYLKQSLKSDGEMFTFRAIPRLHKICIEYKFYFE